MASLEKFEISNLTIVSNPASTNKVFVMDGAGDLVRVNLDDIGLALESGSHKLDWQPDVDNLQGQLDTLNNTDIPQLEADIDDLNNNQLPAVRSDLDNLNNNELPALESDIDTLNTVDLPDLQSQVDTINNTDLPNLEADLANKLDDVPDEITETHILNGSITTPKLVSNAITATEIASGAIVTSHLSADVITANELAIDAVRANNIYADAVTASEIRADAVTANAIKTDAVTADAILADTITANEIGAGVITALEIASDTITANEVGAGEITAMEIGADAVTANKILAGEVNLAHLSFTPLESTDTSTGSIVATINATTETDSNGVVLQINGDKIELNGDTTVNGTFTLNGDALVNGTVVASKIDTGAITTGKLATDSVTATKILAGEVGATEISVTDLNTINANLASFDVSGTTIESISGGSGLRIDSSAQLIALLNNSSQTVTIQHNASEPSTTTEIATASFTGKVWTSTGTKVTGGYAGASTEDTVEWEFTLDWTTGTVGADNKYVITVKTQGSPDNTTGSYETIKEETYEVTPNGPNHGAHVITSNAEGYAWHRLLMDVTEIVYDSTDPQDPEVTLISVHEYESRITLNNRALYIRSSPNMITKIGAGFEFLTTVTDGGSGAVDSVFGRTGDVYGQSGDYDISQITGGLQASVAETISGSWTFTANTVFNQSDTTTLIEVDETTNGAYIRGFDTSTLWSIRNYTLGGIQAVFNLGGIDVSGNVIADGVQLGSTGTYNGLKATSSANNGHLMLDSYGTGNLYLNYNNSQPVYLRGSQTEVRNGSNETLVIHNDAGAGVWADFKNNTSVNLSFGQKSDHVYGFYNRTNTYYVAWITDNWVDKKIDSVGGSSDTVGHRAGNAAFGTISDDGRADMMNNIYWKSSDGNGWRKFDSTNDYYGMHRIRNGSHHFYGGSTTASSSISLNHLVAFTRGGHVGIGTSSPSTAYSLEIDSGNGTNWSLLVRGRINTTGDRIRMYGTSTTNCRLEAYDRSSWTGDQSVDSGIGKIEYHAGQWYIASYDSKNNIVQFRNHNGSNVSSVETNGEFHAPDFVLSSDKRLKSEVELVDQSLSTLMNIPVRKYKKNDQWEYGYYAQDVQEHYPELVKEGGEGYLHLKQNSISALNTRAIQELNHKIEKLERELYNRRN